MRTDIPSKAKRDVAIIDDDRSGYRKIVMPSDPPPKDPPVLLKTIKLQF